MRISSVLRFFNFMDIVCFIPFILIQVSNPIIIYGLHSVTEEPNNISFTTFLEMIQKNVDHSLICILILINENKLVFVFNNITKPWIFFKQVVRDDQKLIM